MRQIEEKADLAQQESDEGYWRWIWNGLRSILTFDRLDTIFLEYALSLTVFVIGTALAAFLMCLWILGISIPLTLLLLTHGAWREGREEKDV